ncbi:MAG: hypothetical protein ABIJ96_09055 [Elusimicrobiota bacterium]
MQDRLPERPSGRVYFGEEACERRLPSARAYADAVRRLKKAGAPATLVFPPLTDAGVEKARAVLRELKGAAVECVVNDYGMLELARREAPRLELVIGRLLSRVLAKNIIDLHAYSAKEYASFCAFLNERRVVRFDFDVFSLDLLKCGLAALPVPASLYTPFDLAAFTRRCTIAGSAAPDAAPFAACRQECRGLAFDVSHAYLDGAYFIYENLVLRYSPEPAKTDARIDRIVRWHPPDLRLGRRP